MFQEEINWLNKIKNEAIDFGIKVGFRLLFIVLILVFGFKLCAFIDRRLGKKKNWKLIDPTLRTFLLSSIRILSRCAVIALAIMTAGVAMSSFLAVVGTAGLAIGLALQGALSNVAAGVLIITNKPYRVGDYIETSAISGTVTAIGLFYTYLATPDNKAVIAPNNTLTTTAITNYGVYATRRYDFDFGLSYQADAEQVRKLVTDLASAHPLVLKEPEPLIALTRYDASAINFKFRAWVNAADYWNFYFEFPTLLKQTLDREGIEIPFPQVVVHRSGAERL